MKWPPPLLLAPLLLLGTPAAAWDNKPAVAAMPALLAPEGLDHVLLWRQDVDAATAILTVQLGFHVRSGGTFPDGIANRLVTFKDQSYLELLYFVKDRAELTGDALKAYQFTQSSGGGANNIAFAVQDVDAVSRHLSARGFALNDPDPATYDPDGPGPKPAVANMWRTVSFKEPPLRPSDMFFIRYNVPPPSGERAGDLAALARHPNGANAMSSVWLLSADLDGDKARLERLGFEAAGRVELASVNATGLRFRAANEAILLLEPSGKGLAAEALAKRGPHVFGISVAVDDLGRAERIVGRGTGLPLVRAAGSHGEGFFVPLHETLGLSIEFHQSR